jgi:hypothetical protein
MARLYAVLFFLQLGLAVAALISCLSTEDGDINAIPRLWWILIILFFPLVGSIAWFVAGRTRTQPRSTRPAGGGFPEGKRRRPVAPDDDPEFLRSLKPRPEERDDDQPKT